MIAGRFVPPAVVSNVAISVVPGAMPKLQLLAVLQLLFPAGVLGPIQMSGVPVLGVSRISRCSRSSGTCRCAERFTVRGLRSAFLEEARCIRVRSQNEKLMIQTFRRDFESAHLNEQERHEIVNQIVCRGMGTCFPGIL